MEICLGGNIILLQNSLKLFCQDLSRQSNLPFKYPKKMSAKMKKTSLTKLEKQNVYTKKY